MAQSVNEDEWIIESVTNSLEDYIQIHTPLHVWWSRGLQGEASTTNHQVYVRNGDADWIIHILIYSLLLSRLGRASVKLRPQAYTSTCFAFDTLRYRQTQSIQCVINYGFCELDVRSRQLSVVGCRRRFFFYWRWSLAHVRMLVHFTLFEYKLQKSTLCA